MHNYPSPKDPGALLRSISEALRDKPVYAYIVTTIKTKCPDHQLVQEGSAPNFDGGRITLCTCKHKDRATFSPTSDRDDPWKNVWVAGFTSKTEGPSRSLAYLMCVERSFLSQMELWHALPSSCREAKCASRSARGDLFKPKRAARDADAPFNPTHYYAPAVGRHVHSTPENPMHWHQDIRPWGRSSKPHRLLLGQATQSYRWMNVKMVLKLDAMGISAHHRMFASLSEFVANLQEYDP